VKKIGLVFLIALLLPGIILTTILGIFKQLLSGEPLDNTTFWLVTLTLVSYVLLSVLFFGS
jgi:hypothetical protein